MDLSNESSFKAAVFLASKRADALLDQGDTDGFTVWLKAKGIFDPKERKTLLEIANDYEKLASEIGPPEPL